MELTWWDIFALFGNFWSIYNCLGVALRLFLGDSSPELLTVCGWGLAGGKSLLHRFLLSRYSCNAWFCHSACYFGDGWCRCIFWRQGIIKSLLETHSTFYMSVMTVVWLWRVVGVLQPGRCHCIYRSKWRWMSFQSAKRWRLLYWIDLLEIWV